MATEGAVTEHVPTASDYIIHHLTFLTNRKQASVVDFSVVNYDSIFFTLVIGVVAAFVLWRAARKATSGRPGRLQAGVEMLVEMVDDQAKSIVHNANSRRLVVPLALTIYIWVILLNSMDFLPVDLLPFLGEHVLGLDHLRVVATADLSVTMAMSIGVLLLCLFYNVKIKGAGGWAHELISAPFGDKWFLYPLNFAMQLIEFIAKTVSHGMRLFGNMYAGELLFLLLALMGGAFTLSLTGILLFSGQIVFGLLWAVFHLLIVWLQAFVFMMLTLVYLGQAHDHH